VTDLTRQVAANTDDVTVIPLWEYINPNDVLLGAMHWGDGASLDSGVRFTNITIPPGATIESAEVQLYSDTTYGSSGTVAVRLYGQAADSPGTFSTYADFAARSNTTAYSDWSISTNWTTTEWVSTPSLAAVIQEIIDRPGWTSGNALVIFFRNNGTADSTGRAANDYNWSTSLAPKLVITYSEPASIPLYVGGSQVTEVHWDGKVLAEIWYGGTQVYPVGEGVAIPSLAAIIDGMTENNDAAADGMTAPWALATGGGALVMGNIPRGTNTPTWWDPADASLQGTAWWYCAHAWFQLLEGVGNTATNTRVVISPLRMYALSKTYGTWTPLQVDLPLYNMVFLRDSYEPGSYTLNEESRSNDYVSLKIDNDNILIHGWSTGGFASITPDDVDAIVVFARAKLELDDDQGTDDRDDSVYLLGLGADYYPDVDSSVDDFAPETYNPGVGLSRLKRVTEDWQTFGFVTIEATGVAQDPGGGITVAELEAAPPPLLPWG